jgi:hypothetical protein
MKKLQQILNAKGAQLTEDGIIGAKTLTALDWYITNRINTNKWLRPKDGLVFLRTDAVFSNTFDDYCAVYKGGVCVAVVPCSTTAGDKYVFSPITHMGITGTAVAAEQQVIGSHRFVTNKKWSTLWLGAPYFQQILPITIWRDGSRDRTVSKVNKQFGLFGINIHRGGVTAIVGSWSAGCMVIPDNHWFPITNNFVNGESIDFTLLEI